MTNDDGYKAYVETLGRIYGPHNPHVNPDIIEPDGTELIAVGYGSKPVYMTAEEYHQHCQSRPFNTPEPPKEKPWTFDYYEDGSGTGASYSDTHEEAYGTTAFKQAYNDPRFKKRPNNLWVGFVVHAIVVAALLLIGVAVYVLLYI